ncbi:hypothetical protein C8R47DRAFT_1083363 [Mycena vitilis]|nr:hypothetical protein C8R47DRAFT_1083363 [Mycena vitilis]
MQERKCEYKEEELQDDVSEIKPTSARTFTSHSLRSLCQGGLLSDAEMMVFYAYREVESRDIQADTVHGHLAQRYGTPWTSWTDSVIPRLHGCLFAGPATVPLSSIIVGDNGSVVFPAADLENMSVANTWFFLQEYIEQCWTIFEESTILDNDPPPPPPAASQPPPPPRPASSLPPPSQNGRAPTPPPSSSSLSQGSSKNSSHSHSRSPSQRPRPSTPLPPSAQEEREEVKEKKQRRKVARQEPGGEPVLRHSSRSAALKPEHSSSTALLKQGQMVQSKSTTKPRYKGYAAELVDNDPPWS